jgi:predicted NBD/HSP70 family sugar kinase
VTPGQHPQPLAARADQSSLRRANLSLVTRTALNAPEPLSRAGIAAATGMARATASRLVDELVTGRVLAELTQLAPSGRGRPATPVAAGRTFAALGLQVEVGGVTARLIALSGEVLAERVEPADLRTSEPGPTLTRLAELGADLIVRAAGTRVVGAGLALPGIVSTSTGRLLTAPNLGWAGVIPEPYFRSAMPTDLPLRIGNEADLAARVIAESAPGRHGPLLDFFYLSGETGIGGAAVLGGRTATGRHGRAGEIGHVTVDPHGDTCPCGSTGCLELYAGRLAVLEAAGLAPATSTDELLARVHDGEPSVVAAVERASWALGVALAGAINLLDISVIVLGGHLGEMADVVIPALRRHLETRVMSARWESPRIEAAPRHAAPGATGAAFAELAALIDDPARWIRGARDPESPAVKEPSGASPNTTASPARNALL